MKIVKPKHLTDLEALELIWGPPDEILTYENFRQYQVWMADKIVELDAMLLGAEMGLGKTAAVLWAIAKLLEEKKITRALVVAPLKVAEETWPAEIAKWGFSRHLTYRVVTGDLEERKAALRYGPAKVTIINRENLLWLRQYVGIVRWPFDFIAYDEASRLKGGSMKTNPAIRKDGTRGEPKKTELGVLQSVRHRTKKIVELTGTPAPNGLIDLWGPVKALDNGKRLGSSLTAYKRRWFREDRWAHTIEPFLHSEAEIMEALKDIFFSLREEDYLKLPPLLEQDHEVQMTVAEMKKYKDFEKQMAMYVVNNAGDREVIKAVNNGVLTGKMLQFANGSMYLGDKFDELTGDRFPRESVLIHKHKLDALQRIMDEAMGQPVLVAYSFQFDKDAILKKFPYCRFFGDSQHDMRDWSAGRIKMLLTHPASAGHGLNLQFGSNIAVWYGLTWSSELYQQFIKRLHRSGQKRDFVILHRIVMRGTVDMSLLPALRRRRATEDQIKDAVRVRLERIAA